MLPICTGAFAPVHTSTTDPSVPVRTMRDDVRRESSNRTDVHDRWTAPLTCVAVKVAPVALAIRAAVKTFGSEADDPEKSAHVEGVPGSTRHTAMSRSTTSRSRRPPRKNQLQVMVLH